MTPFSGENRVTSPYGMRTHPISGKRQMHNGVDIVTSGAYPGKGWEVREVTGGTVKAVTSDQWRGKYVDVQTAPKEIERYQHLASTTVKVGQILKQGDVIGMAGTTGDSTGVHLHFEVQKNGSPVEPSVWSGVTNGGTTPGNNNLDGGGASTVETFQAGIVEVGPLSPGDVSALVNRAREMATPTNGVVIKVDGKVVK